MLVEKIFNENKLLVKVNGSLDIINSPKFREELADINFNDLTGFTFDFANVDYVSSAGLRELLIVLKKIKSAFPLKIINVNSVVNDIFIDTQFNQYFEYTLAEEKFDYTHVSFKELLAYKVKNCPDTFAFTYADKQYTWNDLEKYSQIIAEDLSQQGVRKGSHVGICGANSANWIFTYFAIQKLGGIALLLNFSLTVDEMLKFSKVGDITHFCYGEMPLITDEDSFIKTLTSSDTSIEHVYSFKNSIDFSKRLNEYEKLNGKFENKIEADSPCVMIFTSGSTGVPKGVLLSAYNLLNSAKSNADEIFLTKDDKACLMLPLFHVFGFVGGLCANAIADAEMIMPVDIKTSTLIKVISERKCTIFHSVPTMLLAIVNNKEFDVKKFYSLRCSILSGAPASEAQVLMLCEKFPNNHFLSLYGLSEMAPVTTTYYGDTVSHISKTIGKPVKNIQLRIYDNEKKEVCPVGKPGEIQIQGFNLMVGYYKVPLADQPIDNDGWLHTGDLAYCDEEGYLHFVGRLKELIIRGGENIVPNEIISAISQESYIADAKVFGVPDEFWGETVAAAIVMKNGFTFDEEKLRESLKNRLAKFKIPANFIVYDSFPSLPNGKVDSVNLKKDVIQKVLKSKSEN